jgi:hypothetical protein
MNLNTKREITEAKTFVQKVLDPGVKLVKINQITLEPTSWEGNDSQVKFWLEGPEEKGDFEGFKTYGDVVAKGLVGEATLGYGDYTSQENDETRGMLNPVDSLLNNLAYIAEKAGVLEAFQGLQVSSVDELVKEFSKLVQGKYIWMVLGGKEFIRNNGRMGVNLYLVSTKIKDADGLSYFQVYCKHKDFATEVVTDSDGNQKLQGINVVGKNKGDKTYLDFQPGNTWYFKPAVVEASDKETDEDADFKEVPAEF